jgi:hypothetical protein
MSEVLECRRELLVDKPAEQVWDWLSNLRHAMTANQFHMSIDCGESEARHPRVSLEVPILHNVMGRQAYRIARVTRFENYAISWGERLPDDAGYEDAFPHSEGWKVEALGPNRCKIQNHLRGRFMFAAGQYIGKHVWETVIPPILDNDLQDVAFASGAIEQRRPVPLPSVSAALLRLAHAREIDGKPAGEVLNIATRLSKHSN